MKTICETDVERARKEMLRTWNAACTHDGIDPTSKFVVFSAENPFVAENSEATRTYMRLRNTYSARIKRQARRDAIESLGMHEVRGALGGHYIE